MSLLGRVWEAVRGAKAPPDGPSRPSAAPLRFRSRYDAAGDQTEQREHWSLADSLSANALNDPATRARLRNRARYETRNNGYAKGLVSAIAMDVVGTGPRLQLTFPDPPGVPPADEYTPRPGEDTRGRLTRVRTARETARVVERAWRDWCRAVDLADKLRVKHESKVRDGECFALLTNNDLVGHPVKLDVRLVESDQVETPLDRYADERVVDGVEFDRAGNPVAYFVSRTHPGDRLGAFPDDFARVDAANVLHWYRADRPGQVRGVSELAPALNLFGQLRRYTLATITAAEFSATVSGVMKTDLPPPEDGEAVTVSQGTEVPLAPGSLLTLASGWDATGFAAEQPTTTYGEFKGEILAEAGRSAGAPRNLTSGDSSQFNFASGRLDHLPYQRGVWIERQRDRRQLDKVFAAWWQEYTRVPESEGGAPRGLPALAAASWDWHWDGFEHLDPTKETDAAQVQLAMGLTTLSELCAARGVDWEEVLEQRFREKAREKELAAKYGVELTPAEPAAPAMDDEFEEVAGG